MWKPKENEASSRSAANNSSVPSTSTSVRNKSNSIRTPESGSSNTVNLIKNPSRLLSNEIRLKYNAQRESVDRELVDVVFQFEAVAGARRRPLVQIGAHKFILLDSPEYHLFHENLIGKSGIVTINVSTAPRLTPESVDTLLNYIYGVELKDLKITNNSLDAFLQTLIFFKAQGAVIGNIISQLVHDFGSEPLESIFASNFDELSSPPGFWILDKHTIEMMCKVKEPAFIEEKLMDLMAIDKTNRKDYLESLKKLIKYQHIQNSEGSGVGVQTELVNVATDAESKSDSDNDSFDCQMPNLKRFDTIGNNLFNDKAVPRPLKSPASGIRRTDRKRRTSCRLSFPENGQFGNFEKRHLSSVDLATVSCSAKRTKTTRNDGNCSFPLQRKNSLTSKADDGNSPTLGKKSLNGLDILFKDNLNFIKKNVTSIRSIFNEDYMTSWRTLWENTSNKAGKSRGKNCQRFLDNGGLELLFKSARKYANVLDPEFRQALLALIENCAETSEVRHLVFTDDVVKYVLKELESYDSFPITTNAGEVLAVFLDSYETANWTLNISRKDVSSKLRHAVEQWDLDLDRDNFLANKEEFQDLVNLIKGTDSAAQLCGLWSLNYYTKVDSNIPKRNIAAKKYLVWLQWSGCENRLRAIYDQDKEKLMSKYAKTLLDKLDIDL